MLSDTQRIASIDDAAADVLAVSVALERVSRVWAGRGPEVARGNDRIVAGAIRRGSRMGGASGTQSNKQDGRFHTGTDTRGMRLVPWPNQ